MKKISMVLILGVLFLQIFAQRSLKGSGGPDNFGYRWIDSDETGGPVYSWVEISSLGQALGLSDDSAQEGMALGFSFLFYENTYTTMTVSSNGFISFTSWDSANNTSIPLSSEPNDLIAAFWDDLNPGSQGEVYYYQDTANQRAIVQYDNVPKYGSTDGNTFQVIINSDKSIVLQYKEMTGVLDQCTVGIENLAGDDGIQIAFDQSYIKNNLAVKFYPQEVILGGSILLSETSIDYGYVSIGSDLSHYFSITNTSSDEVLQGNIVTVSGYSVADSSKNSLEFTINPAKSKTFDLKFLPVVSQIYDGYIIINSSDSASTPDSIYVTGEGVSPDISLSVSDTLFANSAPGGSSSVFFSIINTGKGQLEFTTFAEESSKNEEKGSGGPDFFGYTWKDSDEAGGPVYNWVEISGTGTALSLADDQLSSPISIGFDFPFYGSEFSSVKICSNGFLSFTTTATAYSNTTIPLSSEPNNILAVFWDDLLPDAGGIIYYYNDPVLKRFIVQYNNVQKINSERSTYEVILHYDGSIVYQYKDMKGTLDQCTVGIEDSSGTVGSLAVFNTTSYTAIKNSHAIEFYPPENGWLGISPSKGLIEGMGSQEMTAGFNAAGLTTGVYYGNIYVYSTDPDTQNITVPVKYSVYELTAPLNVTTSVSTGTMTVDWDDVPYATSYKIYSSNDPYGTFTEDVSGNFSGSSWSTSIVNAKKFYKVTALDAQ